MRRTLIAVALLALTAQAPVTFLNQSGTITLGGTAQTLMAANPSRHGCILQNNSAGDLWISDVGTAAAAPPSFKVPTGAQYLCAGSPGPSTTGAPLSIWGATTAQAFSAREW